MGEGWKRGVAEEIQGGASESRAVEGIIWKSTTTEAS